VCAARDRAANALANSATCPESAAADLDQIGDLVAQARRVAPRALANGDLTATKWARIDADLTAAGNVSDMVNALGSACTRLAPCPAAPRTGCRTAGDSKLLMKRRPGASPNADQLRWSWSDGAATSTGDFSDPIGTSDYAVCVYEGAPGSEELAYEIAVPPSSLWRSQRNGYRYYDRVGGERGVRRIKLKSGGAAKSALSVRATGASYLASRFPVAVPVTAQLVNLRSDGCWESGFTAGNVQRSDSQIFSAHTP